MRTLRPTLTLLLFTAIFSNCSLVFAETADTHGTHYVQQGIDWPGIYYGFTPCDDCKGVKSSLALNKNNTYTLITQYVGKSEREIVEKGKFIAGDKNNTLVLTPRNSEMTRHYLVGENSLIQLDDNGNRISGKLADRYILRRTDLTQPAQAHASH